MNGMDTLEQTGMDSFEPRWATPPGATVLDLLQEKKLAVAELAHEVRCDLHQVSRLLHGLEPLTEEWARNLSRIFGATPSFWQRREELYRSDLERLCPGEVDEEDWLHKLPLKEMVRFGWIESGKTPVETLVNTCAFLGVATSKAFEVKYQRLLSRSAYRNSTAFETDSAAVVAWLRQGEIQAATVDCQPWNSSALEDSLDEIRALTRIASPTEFLPLLQAMLARCGAAVVVARAPAGCRASGATRFLTPEKALLQLSFRYLADDQLWFTVFHEIGHLLLHASDQLFLEGLEERHAEAEREADEFALQALFKKVGVQRLQEMRISPFEIARLAKHAGISPGIVVGQLQELDRIPYKHFNYMKVRYAWET